MEQEVMAIAEQVTALITVYGLKVIGAVAILIVGCIAAKWVASATGRG